MIELKKISQEEPFKIFIEKYNKANKRGQEGIEIMCISSYSQINKEVNSRYVNLKIIEDKNFIFFSNYNSTKSKEFNEHKQISALIYWNKINTQIRMKGFISKTDTSFNQDYFKNRSESKNALAISSDQSAIINSYDDVVLNYKRTLDEQNLLHCPEYWGGFTFSPYYFEFWEGHEFRLNKRQVYFLDEDKWINFFLQP